jgi:hypothetical protein
MIFRLNDGLKNVNLRLSQLEFRHKESRGETLVGLAYVGKMGRGGRRSGGWGTFRI